jgi:hypothetical protein
MRRKPLVFGTQADLLLECEKNKKLFDAIKAATLKACFKNPLFTADEKDKKQ